jgi:hypothetical protein
MTEELCEYCYEDLVYHHRRNLRCRFSKTIFRRLPDAVYWNPYNKVVQDHRDGTIYEATTNVVRERLGLRVPWTPEFGRQEVKDRPVGESLVPGRPRKD